MILDNIKDLIKDMESVLIKDNRFKEEMHFKNMVKTIYNCESTKLNTIYQMPSYDITPIVLSRITQLGKTEIGPKGKETDTYKHDCDEVIEDLKKLIKELIRKVREAEAAAVPIIVDPIKADIIAKIEAAEKAGNFKEALRLALTI